MKSIFNTDDTQSIIKRISALQPDQSALWGTMQVAQMLRHCQYPIDQAAGKLILKKPPFLIGLLGPMFKNKFLKEKPFGKGSPTSPAYVVTDTLNFEEEKHALIEKVNQLAATTPATFDGVKHPFFGKLTGQEVGVLQYNHIDHHLSQFGA